MSTATDEVLEKELASFIEQESARSQVQSSIHTLTDMCWKKCVGSSIGGRFSRGEETCLTNCVDRFLDSSLFIINKVEEARRQAGGA
ncbi:mitochondrial import inner membrane translocase subunit TIM8 [Dacryopinax primogenitus]|uniref:Mitochondrial import inner membrane translocase subunit n=1 Tax=Dacryopinax primogenitus (strain DJM 731) TaxID=1858805 RepID=M5G837_DACPD|nr:mitochondrial import inner membrane translocase subunit TIM8 [Dacryopinax primogenitus]EJT99922.1 mitochondrial import inner membrane translocase subunit TIM8 [Dacryopinax primogenitus]